MIKIHIHIRSNKKKYINIQKCIYKIVIECCFSHIKICLVQYIIIYIYMLDISFKKEIQHNWSIIYSVLRKLIYMWNIIWKINLQLRVANLTIRSLLLQNYLDKLIYYLLSCIIHKYILIILYIIHLLHYYNINIYK